ncbi:MAG: hypothetical protein ACRD2L_16690, partial [Terriglobia bacterium]
MMRPIVKNCATALAASMTLIVTPALVASGRSLKAKAATQQSDINSRAEQLFHEALILSGVGDETLVRGRLLQAIGLWIQIGEPEKAARSSLQMGDSCRRMKRFQESLYYYKRGLEVKAISSQARAMIFNGIANVYAELYHFDLARRFYGKAIEEARVAKDVSLQAEALSGMAALYYRSGEKERAIPSIGQARRLSHQLGNDEMEARLLHLTGRIAREQGLLDRSREALNEALVVFR